MIRKICMKIIAYSGASFYNLNKNFSLLCIHIDAITARAKTSCI
jgi:hypothetical protein